MKLVIDRGMLNRTVRNTVGRFKSMKITLKSPGTGEVVVSRRKKYPGERRKPLHGRAIANLLAKLGHDPFKYPDHIVAAIDQEVAEEISDALEDAFRARHHRRQRVRDALLIGARKLAEFARWRIEQGLLAPMTEDRAKRKRWRRNKTTRYGDPPPYGIVSGRFVEGIRARWRRGRSRK